MATVLPSENNSLTFRSHSSYLLVLETVQKSMKLGSAAGYDNILREFLEAQ